MTTCNTRGLRCTIWGSPTPHTHVKIAGIEVPDRAVLELAMLLRQHGFEHTAISLERAFDTVSPYYALSVEQREQIVLALDDPPAEVLSRLRGVLLEGPGRVRDGVA